MAEQYIMAGTKKNTWIKVAQRYSIKNVHVLGVNRHMKCGHIMGPKIGIQPYPSLAIGLQYILKSGLGLIYYQAQN